MFLCLFLQTRSGNGSISETFLQGQEILPTNRIAAKSAENNSLELQLVPLHIDPAFIAVPQFYSAWRQSPLPLPEMRVYLKRGFARIEGHNNPDGRVSLSYKEGKKYKICYELKADQIVFSDFLRPKSICTEKLRLDELESPYQLALDHPFSNMFLQMVDARDYVKEVLGVETKLTRVLVGGVADTLALKNRSFAPCFSRAPNLNWKSLNAKLPGSTLSENFSSR